ncbi:EF-hand domain-containing protein [Azonexus hydrophilus]|uniref:EF-hand domain-containing protein n=1 Tax=Azonexus hydrophilus TaxID=418702 RepID=UPI0003F68B00|nr:EF-hand domain-containing protein [Azonexus hydrophilus]
MISGVGSSSQVSQLFSRLDSKSQGYLEKSDLVSAFSAISGSGDSAAEELFSVLDADSDGKVTESEFASTLSKLQEELEAQFGQMRMQGGMPPPPPPPMNDSGFTKEELEAQLAEIGGADSDRANLIADVVANFEAADTDGDGKVSFKEAQAYQESQRAESTASSAATSAEQVASTESQVMMRVMQLMQAYGRPDSMTSSLLSALA